MKKAVPPHWDPASLSRFIQAYGTHIIVDMGVGGLDILCVKQKPSSAIPPAELRAHLDDLRDCLFSNETIPLPELKPKEVKKKGLTMIWSKRGGDIFAQSHSKWLQTVVAYPDSILFRLVPITLLLTGIPGSGYLSHAINVYLHYCYDRLLSVAAATANGAYDKSLEGIVTKDIPQDQRFDVEIKLSGKLELLNKILQEIKHQRQRVLVLFRVQVLSLNSDSDLRVPSSTSLQLLYRHNPLTGYMSPLLPPEWAPMRVAARPGDITGAEDYHVPFDHHDTYIKL
ncbi:hypothetical protein FXO37_23998 [Capsicum annuum]|nr:hypothetical protein FXO37_23998 [Capsicum annuum]